MEKRKLILGVGLTLCVIIVFFVVKFDLSKQNKKVVNPKAFDDKYVEVRPRCQTLLQGDSLEALLGEIAGRPQAFLNKQGFLRENVRDKLWHELQHLPEPSMADLGEPDGIGALFQTNDAKILVILSLYGGDIGKSLVETVAASGSNVRKFLATHVLEAAKDPRFHELPASVPDELPEALTNIPIEYLIKKTDEVLAAKISRKSKTNFLNNLRAEVSGLEHVSAEREKLISLLKKKINSETHPGLRADMIKTVACLLSPQDAKKYLTETVADPKTPGYTRTEAKWLLSILQSEGSLKAFD